MSSQFPPPGYDPTSQGQGSGYPPPPPGYAPPPPGYPAPQSGYPPPPPGYAAPVSGYYAPAGMAQPAYMPVVQKTSGLAIASLVLGIISLCGLGSLAAVICGHISLSQIKASNGTLTGRGLAIAGLILGYIGLAAIILYIVFTAILAANGALTPTTTP